MRTILRPAVCGQSPRYCREIGNVKTPAQNSGRVYNHFETAEKQEVPRRFRASQTWSASWRSAKGPVRKR